MAAGLTHYKISSPTYSVLPLDGHGADKPLYVEKGNQCLMNEFGIFVLDELGTFQNMGMYTMPEADKLDEFFDVKFPGIGTQDDIKVKSVSLFSKELPAYLDTLLYVACFYKADDSRVTSKLQQQYEYNLKRYAQVSDVQLQSYLKKKMLAWLTRFPHKTSPNYDPSRDVAEKDNSEEDRASSPDHFQVSEGDEPAAVKIGGNKGNDEEDNEEESDDSHQGE